MPESKPEAPPFVHHGLPTDERVLAAIGKIALRHGQLDNQMRLLVKDLTGVSKPEALDATLREGSGQLRERIRKLARMRLGDGSALVRLQALLERASRVTRRRNEILHWVWGTEFDGGTMVRVDDHTFQPAPTVPELNALVETIEVIIDDLIEARLEGFLAEALERKPG